jgi:gluconokinase
VTENRIVIVMGITGSGKTTVGQALAARCGWAFYDADEFHSPANKQKMRDGIPLTDQDRWPWLEHLRALAEAELLKPKSAVIACSALRGVYRQRLRPNDPALSARLHFVYLRVSPELARQRVASRPGHYMPPSLVESQLEALEEPKDAVTLDAARPVEELVKEIAAALKLAK